VRQREVVRVEYRNTFPLDKEGVDVNNVPLCQTLPPLVGSLESVPQGSYTTLVGTLQSAPENSAGNWN
jgi:hypothetical protein